MAQTLTKVQRENLALIYAQAFYALEGKAISVSARPNGLFQVRETFQHFNDAQESYYLDELLDGLHRITETLQSKKIRSLTERG